MIDSISWHTPHTLLYIQVSGTMSLADVKEMMDRSYTLIDGEDSPDGSHAIIDISRCQHYDRDLMNLQAVKALSRAHRRMRWVAVIDPNPNPVVRFVGLSILKLFKIHYVAARTKDEALDVLSTKPLVPHV